MDPEVLTDRIREFCAKAITTPATEIEPVAAELQAALREHALFVQNMAAKSLLTVEMKISSTTD
jgi:hypothetical protein